MSAVTGPEVNPMTSRTDSNPFNHYADQNYDIFAQIKSSVVISCPLLLFCTFNLLDMIGLLPTAPHRCVVFRSCVALALSRGDGRLNLLHTLAQFCKYIKHSIFDIQFFVSVQPGLRSTIFRHRGTNTFLLRLLCWLWCCWTSV